MNTSDSQLTLYNNKKDITLFQNLLYNFYLSPMRAQIRFTEKPHLKIIIFMEKNKNIFAETKASRETYKMYASNKGTLEITSKVPLKSQNFKILDFY